MPPEPVPPSSDSVLWLAQEWGRQITRAVESMTGESVPITLAAHQLTSIEIDPSQEELLWWEQPLSLGADSNIWVGAAAGSWKEIGNRALGSAGVDNPTPEDLRNSYLEIVRQSLAALATAASARAGKEISCLEGHAGLPTEGLLSDASEASAYAFDMTLGEQAFPLLAVFAHAIANHLDAPPDAPLELSAKPAPQQPADTAAAPTELRVPGSLDLLLDVQLPVSVSFGRAQLMLKDVLKLTTGSIVELNRTLSEPVEVIVNNCVIARGEVVVVEGNYGIRIKQVINRQERLRTLY